MKEIIKQIVKSIHDELKEEFHSNFARQSFFGSKWKPRKRGGSGAILVGSGRLRRGMIATSRANTIRFSNDAPYAKIHNDGGKIKITPKMRKFFWAMYYKHSNNVTYKIKTREIAGKKSQQQSDEATYWQNMALTKKKKITIPQRQYIGSHPKVDKTVEKIVTSHISNYFNNLDKHFKR